MQIVCFYKSIVNFIKFDQILFNRNIDVFIQI